MADENKPKGASNFTPINVIRLLDSTDNFFIAFLPAWLTFDNRQGTSVSAAVAENGTSQSLRAACQLRIKYM